MQAQHRERDEKERKRNVKKSEKEREYRKVESEKKSNRGQNNAYGHTE